MTAHVTGDEQETPAEQPRTVAALGHGINPLQQLIRQRQAERGWSYGEVARRGGLPRSTVYTLVTTRNLTRPPRPDTIDALARGLDVPVAAVRAAAAESTGLHYYDQGPAGPEHPADRERGTPDRQHRRTDTRRPAARGRARRIVAEQGLVSVGGRLALALGTAEISAVPRARPPRGTVVRPGLADPGTLYPIGKPAGIPSWSASSP